MRRSGLRTRIILSFLFIIVLFGTLIAILGYWAIRTSLIDRAQKQMRYNLAAAHSVYENELESMKRSFEMLGFIHDPAKIKVSLNLDYLYVIERADSNLVLSPLVRQAFHGNAGSGTRIIDSTELVGMSENLFEKAVIAIRQTPRAKPSSQTVLTSAMALECAAPIFDSNGIVARVIFGGKIINRYNDLINRIHRIVFEDKLYDAKPVGTVTIFQNDVRVATNVLDRDGEPAIGTRISSVVYDRVIRGGVPWYSRAFVVTDWYLTAYEPIRDVTGQIVGVLYVGLLEAPLRDAIRSYAIVFLVIIVGCTLLAVILTLVLAGSIANPLTHLVKATTSLADGNLMLRAPDGDRLREIHELTMSFNEMATKIHQRDARLRSANEDLAALNKRYIDLIGMVSHELKGILSSTMLNACSVRDGYFGALNDAQARALSSVARNLDYFDMTVRNFLNLSRIEKDELSLTIAEVRLKEEVVEESAAVFNRQAQERHMIIENNISPAMVVMADNAMLLMMMNNLIGNAVKYGAESGTIRISANHLDAAVAIEVYNDGRPLTDNEEKKLFKRFSRLDTSPEAKRVRGTGLGLFISREIVEQHGGTIRHESRELGNAFIFTLPLTPKLK
ncbi:MAG: cache domain-containing protein [Chitinispirillaceae bacterium]|jgi:two-component system NtrC family sensor kinase